MTYLAIDKQVILLPEMECTGMDCPLEGCMSPRSATSAAAASLSQEFPQLRQQASMVSPVSGIARDRRQESACFALSHLYVIAGIPTSGEAAQLECGHHPGAAGVGRAAP